MPAPHWPPAEILTYENDQRDMRRPTCPIQEARFPNPENTREFRSLFLPDLSPQLGRIWVPDPGSARENSSFTGQDLGPVKLVTSFVGTAAANAHQLLRIVGWWGRLELRCSTRLLSYSLIPAA
jgi:hypothetical protein